MSKQILFFGNEKLATGVTTKAQIFNGLIEAGFEIKALIIAQKLDKYSDKLEIVKLAKQNRIEVKSFASLKQSVAEIANYNVDMAVLAAYGKIVPPEVLNIFKIGIINIHPSLLPKHRGPTPIESTILNGENETGVSIMKLAADMDAGPIYKQRSIKISPNESKQAIADKLDLLGKKLLLESIEAIVAGNLTPSDQPGYGATYDKLITKEDGDINWNESWAQIDKKIRAYAGWPKARFNIGYIELTLIKAHFENRSGKNGELVKHDGSFGIYCNNGLVVVDQLIPSGAKTMSGQEFIRGYGSKIFS